MIRKLASTLRKAASKPIGVVVFRGLQELNLEWLHRSGGWQRLATGADRLPKTATELTLLQETGPTLSDSQIAALSDWSTRIVASDFEIFGHQVPNLEACDFSADWRFGHQWDKQYFKSYSFYERKQTAYDVKMPWELSRLAFLVPVMAHMVVTGPDTDTIRWVTSVLNRWDQENPLAHSVNW